MKNYLRGGCNMEKENTITIPIHQQWSGMTIQSLFHMQWLAPKKLVHHLRLEKRVSINEESAIWTTPLTTGDRLSISLPEELNKTVLPSQYMPQIVYEDEHLLIVNKPANMDTHINQKQELDTLANAVSSYLRSHGDYRKIRAIHRLDKDTTGAILFAKHALSHAVLDRMLLNKQIERTYWALAEGTIQKNNFTIQGSIGRDRHHPTRRRVSKTGQQAVTHCHVLHLFHKKKLSLIECSLDTGRTHQIRVHLSHIGHPLAGDLLYGGRPIFQRQALHARKLAFIHPFTLKRIECIASFLDTPSIFERFKY